MKSIWGTADTREHKGDWSKVTPMTGINSKNWSPNLEFPTVHVAYSLLKPQFSLLTDLKGRSPNTTVSKCSCRHTLFWNHNSVYFTHLQGKSPNKKVSIHEHVWCVLFCDFHVCHKFGLEMIRHDESSGMIAHAYSTYACIYSTVQYGLFQANNFGKILPLESEFFFFENRFLSVWPPEYIYNMYVKIKIYVYNVSM